MPKSKIRKGKTYMSRWTYVRDPLFVVECPHCNCEIFMSTPGLIERLKLWSMKLKFKKYETKKTKGIRYGR